MFGVPDEITDMTSSLEMVEGKYLYIGRWYSDTGRAPECIMYKLEYGNPPVEDMGHMGHRREEHQPTRGWCAPHREGVRI